MAFNRLNLSASAARKRIAAHALNSLLFFFCNLEIGSGAFVLGGILQPISASLNISQAAAGQAMTAHALATAVLVLFLIAATSARWKNRPESRPQAMPFARGARN